jgi:hypothetical protein
VAVAGAGVTMEVVEAAAEMAAEVVAVAMVEMEV